MNIIQQLGAINLDSQLFSCSRLNSPTLLVILLIITAIIWTLFWKAIALWHAAKNGSKIWFVVLLFVNTMGILEIIYLCFVAKARFFKTCECSGKKCKCDKDGKCKCK